MAQAHTYRLSELLFTSMATGDMPTYKHKQTLEVANEAFGHKTPFVMKGQVEQLEADQQTLGAELQALRDTVAELHVATAAANKAATAATGQAAAAVELAATAEKSCKNVGIVCGYPSCLIQFMDINW